MSSENVFTKENLDMYLKELSKEYRRMGGKAMPAEIILIGGAAIVANYGFRDMTTDVDAVIQAPSVMKDAINRVGDKYELPNGWLNADFLKTDSYSSKLSECSVPYKQFNYVLDVRIITAEYLVAMKLRSGRNYKNDLSDIVGILAEHKKRRTPISGEQIRNAVIKLYGAWESLPPDSRTFIENVLQNDNPEKIYEDIRLQEKQSKELLIKFEEKYPNVANTENVQDILKNLKSRRAEAEKDTPRKSQDHER
jgi:predicted nucleotidyltransferase